MRFQLSQNRYLKRFTGGRFYRKDGVTLIIVICIILAAGWGLRDVKSVFSHYDFIRQERNDSQLQAERRQRVRERRFVRTMAVPAMQAYRRNYQVLPSIVLAQSIVESDWGTSKLYRVARNPFGIKGQYRGQAVTYRTAEYVHGKKIIERAQFRRYPNLATAVKDHDQTLNYGFIHQNHVLSYVQDAKLLQKNHYATDPHYAQKLINVIKAYHLNRYDLQALN